MNKITAAVSSYWHSIDRWLAVLWLGASGVSMVFLWAIAEYWPKRDSTSTQLAATIIGFCLALFVSFLDYHIIIKLWKIYVPVMFLIMLYTLLFGVGIGDANKNWIVFTIASREISVQPSEFLKIVFILTFSSHLAKVRSDISQFRNVVFLCLHALGYILIMYQDTGSTLIFVAIFITMLFCAGLPWRYIFSGIAVIAAAIPLFWYKLLSADQKMRFLVLKDPELDPQGYAWQQTWGIVSLAMGGRQGIGLFAEKHVNVPKNHNDMVFTFIGESSGFIGALGVICLLTAIAFKVLFDSNRANDDTGRFICTGIFSMIISQVFINIGVCLRILPVIGVTLPFFSSGGTSVLSLYIALGLVMSVYRHSSTGLF